ncbi:cytochrome c [bacterium]|nr:MAG: cytochrome c [bacterium]
MYTRDPIFWRAGAISSLVVMVAILIALTINTIGVISAGGANVPPYTVINQAIGYVDDDAQHEYVPTIGGSDPLFGHVYDERQATALIHEGKLVIQSRACLECHSVFGTGAYYAPDLTKSWLDPVWRRMWEPMTQTHTRADAMVAFLMEPDKYPTWTREMPNLHLTRGEAQAVVAYLKWTSSINTNGFPNGFQADPDTPSGKQAAVNR